MSDGKRQGNKAITDFVTTIIIVYLVTALFMYLAQRSFMYYPDTSVPSRAAMGVPDMDVVTVETADGLTISGWYKAPAEPEKPVIVLFHGNASHYAGRSFKARFFMDRGYGYLLAGYRGYGGNEGRPSERGLYEDGRAYMDWLIEQGGIAPEKIVLSGESLGTGVAIQLATEYPDIGALVLETPFTSFVDLARRHFFIFPLRLLMKDRFYNIDKIGDITTPVLFVHGRRDMIVPFDNGHRLYQAANEPKVLTDLPLAGHNDIYMHGAALHILEFLDSRF